jgi:hypothetical protein
VDCRGVANLLKKKTFSLLRIETLPVYVIDCNFTNKSVIIPDTDKFHISGSSIVGAWRLRRQSRRRTKDASVRNHRSCEIDCTLFPVEARIIIFVTTRRFLTETT